MDASPETETATEQSPQRKRGRPPKRKRLNNKIVEDAVPNADPEENVPKRKRGRPPGSTKKKLDKAARKDSTREVNIPYRYSPSPVENKMKAEAEDEADHPRKRGRPLGSTKRPPGSVPKKRGRPPGSSKRLPSSDTVAATPRKRGRPLGSTKRPPADPNMPTPVSNKRGRPPGSKSRSLYSILDAAFSKRRRKSPESSSPSRRRAAAFSPPDNAPNVSLEEAMKELETVYGRIPAESLSRFHRTNMQAVYRLLETDGTFTRDDSPRTDEPLRTTP